MQLFSNVWPKKSLPSVFENWLFISQENTSLDLPLSLINWCVLSCVRLSLIAVDATDCFFHGIL